MKRAILCYGCNRTLFNDAPFHFEVLLSLETQVTACLAKRLITASTCAQRFDIPNVRAYNHRPRTLPPRRPPRHHEWLVGHV